MATRFDKIKEGITKAAAAQKEKTRREYKAFFEHPLFYVALVSSGFLSSLAGMAIGLGVHMEGVRLIATIDIPHVFFAALYAVLFPYFFEYALANWLNKMFHREPNNNYQLYTAYVMIGLTFIGTAITAYSAMDVLVTAGGFFDSFKEIPAGVQKWIAYSLPTMFLLNIVSGEIYRQFTTEAVLLRAANVDLRQTQIAIDMEVTLSQMETKKSIEIAAADEYARRAEIEAPEIGKRKGVDTWNKDSAGYKVQPAMNAKNSDTELADLRAEVERLRQQSPKA